jgi:lipopolysaccharide biosynthesis protein
MVYIDTDASTSKADQEAIPFHLQTRAWRRPEKVQKMFKNRLDDQELFIGALESTWIWIIGTLWKK